MSRPEVDPTFLALPFRSLGEVALARATELGATHADFRFERVRYQHLRARDEILQSASDVEDLGFAVRVIHRGAWGFASGVVLTVDEARRVAETAVAVAEVAATMTTTPVEIAPEPVHADVTWVSAYDVNPLEVATADKAAVLTDWTRRLRTGAAVDHATAFVMAVQENKYYVDEAYDVAVVQPIWVGSEQALWRGVDVRVIDGAVNGAGAVVAGSAGVLRLIQTGSVRTYAVSMLIGVVVILGYYLWR